ncbi:MAG: mechanosensitive ion channel [Dysgonamonadaceae bacterium]|jgi:small conductance mechanosensitive channel|nr:mechanosensitive ion channel [Dysgonamonadaceae bacterium]
MGSWDEIDFKNTSWAEISDQLLHVIFSFGIKLLICIVVYVAGKKLIRFLNAFCIKLMTKRDVDPSVRSFLKSLTNITLTAALIVMMVNILGINNSSFVALLASAGVAVGMALSGTLQNFAGGVMILLFKPYRVGDYIEAQNQAGTVREIQIFNTVLTTSDNRTIFVPNGGLSTGIIMNYSNQVNRRVELIIGIGYGQDYDKAKRLINRIIEDDRRILEEPEPFIAVHKLNDSSVDIVIRVWIPKDDYWKVYFDLNEKIYKTFTEENIDIPFPQVTVHMAEK